MIERDKTLDAWVDKLQPFRPRMSSTELLGYTSLSARMGCCQIKCSCRRIADELPLDNESLQALDLCIHPLTSEIVDRKQVDTYQSWHDKANKIALSAIRLAAIGLAAPIPAFCCPDAWLVRGANSIALLPDMFPTSSKLTVGRLALTGEFFSSLTGKRTDRRSKELRALAEALSEAGDQLTTLSKTKKLDTKAFENISSDIGRAFELIAAWGLEEVGLVDAARAHRTPEDEQMNNAAELELIYLARAGITPLKRLAVTRLALSSSRQGASTLRQALYDDNEEIALSALASLSVITPHHFVDTLQNTARAMLEADEPQRQFILDALLLRLFELDRTAFSAFTEELLANEEAPLSASTQQRVEKLMAMPIEDR